VRDVSAKQYIATGPYVGADVHGKVSEALKTRA
jgi:hypothetical protein